MAWVWFSMSLCGLAGGMWWGGCDLSVALNINVVMLELSVSRVTGDVVQKCCCKAA